LLRHYRNENQSDLFAATDPVPTAAGPALLKARPLLARLLLRVIRNEWSESGNAGAGDEQDHR
jgi:hypothetical protein